MFLSHPRQCTPWPFWAFQQRLTHRTLPIIARLPGCGVILTPSFLKAHHLIPAVRDFASACVYQPTCLINSSFFYLSSQKTGIVGMMDGGNGTKRSRSLSRSHSRSLSLALSLSLSLSRFCERLHTLLFRQPYGSVSLMSILDWYFGVIGQA
jgi:hypothetical protein